MPIFDKGTTRPQTREVLDIIFDMLTSDVPEDKILSMLGQMGMGEEEAKQTLSAAKQRYDALVKSSISAAVDKLLEKEKEELLERVDSKVDLLKKDVLLKMEMNSPQVEKYVDNRVEPLSTDVNSLKSELFSSKIEFANRLKALEDKSGQDEKKSSALILPVLLIIIGIAVMLFGADSERNMLSNAAAIDVAGATDMFIYGIVMLMGIVLIIIGFKKYPKEEKEYAAGLDFVR